MWMMIGMDASASPATKNAGVTNPMARRELPVASCQLPENATPSGLIVWAFVSSLATDN
jgi:hypothetical protein